MAFHTTKTIGDLLAHMDRDELVLPEIQRDFVWTRRSILKLFDSLYRQMPIGHLLVWKAREAVHTKPFEKAAHESPDYSAATELFIRLNSTGRRLRKTDLNMAELAKKVPGLAGSEISRTRSKWPRSPSRPAF